MCGCGYTYGGPCGGQCHWQFEQVPRRTRYAVKVRFPSGVEMWCQSHVDWGLDGYGPLVNRHFRGLGSRPEAYRAAAKRMIVNHGCKVVVVKVRS